MAAQTWLDARLLGKKISDNRTAAGLLCWVEVCQSSVLWVAPKMRTIRRSECFGGSP
jgi:hypothetical protein